MTFTCTIEMDNADFDDPYALLHLLTKLRSAVEYQLLDNAPKGGGLLDSNGNLVGSWKIEP